MRFLRNSKRKGWGLGLTLFVFTALLPAQTELLPFITPAQWTAIESTNNAYGVWFSRQWGRIDQVQRELQIEESRPVLDPQAFGLRLAELATIGREADSRIAETAAANRKLLDPAQLAQLDALVVNQKVIALTYFAPCEYWFTPSTAERPIDVSDLIYSQHRYPDCTKPTLADYLELPPATRADFAARREQLFRTFDQLTLDYEGQVTTYRAALEASPLDPVAIGRSAVAILQVFRDYGDRRTEFINRRYADLSTAQQVKLHAVNDAVLQASRAEAAACYGLLGKPATIIRYDQQDQTRYYATSALISGYFRSGCLHPPPV